MTEPNVRFNWLNAHFSRPGLGKKANNHLKCVMLGLITEAMDLKQ
jgi:hypothetical protein